MEPMTHTATTQLMTHDQAHAEAQRRWGAAAALENTWVYRVGCVSQGTFRTLGAGCTWNDAFADAERFVRWHGRTTPFRSHARQEPLFVHASIEVQRGS